MQDLNRHEVAAHEAQTEAQRESNFAKLVYYNHGFVDFLVSFYELKGKSVLDYGCGIGVFSHLFTQYGCKVSGCDIAQVALDFAKRKTPEATFFYDDFFDSKLDKHYDFIFCRGLGPLMKIEYNEENRAHLKGMLSHCDTAYFILLGNMSGKPDSQFRNNTLDTIRSFFNPAFINIFGYQAVVVGSDKWRAKMYSSIKYSLEHLQELDAVVQMNCKRWLEVNGESELVEPYKKPLYFLSGDQDRYFELDQYAKKNKRWF